MKTTTRILWAAVAVALGLSATETLANPIWLSYEAELATMIVSQSSPSTSSPTPADSRSQSDDLLLRARQAANEGHFDVAEALVQRAEALGVHYNPLNPLADTPAKVRRYVQRKRAAASPNGSNGLLPALPFGNKPQTPPAPADPFAQNTPGRAAPNASGQFGRVTVSHQPAVGQPMRINMSDNTQPWPTDDNDAAGFAMIESLPPTQAGNHEPDRGEANNLLLQARRALAMGDVRRAMDKVNQAKSHQITYGPRDDTPDSVLADIDKYRDLTSRKETREHTEAYRRQFARLMMQQAEALLKWQDYDEAERLTIQARDQQVSYGPLEANPSTLLERIAGARRQQSVSQAGVASPAPGNVANLPAPSLAAKNRVVRLIGRARAALNSGDIASAETFAQAAMDLQVPESNFGPGEDRPGLVLLDVQKARRAGGSAVVQASATSVTPATGQLPTDQKATQAVYDTANDSTRNMPANAQQWAANEMPRPLMLGQATPVPAPPIPGTASPRASAPGETAADLVRQGEDALKAHKIDEALQYYRRAAQNRDQLDPPTAQLLQDRLQMLSSSPPAQAPQGSLADEALAKQQLLARQVNSDVAYQERRAAQIRESNPKAALALLEQVRMRVEAAGLEPNAKAIILRRVDRNIGEMRQFIDNNRARIELAERNDQTREEIDREQQYNLEVQQRLAELGDKFNKLCDEQRYAEAEVVAKEAYDLAPNHPFARQLNWNAKFVRRVALNREIASRKEEGVIAALADVDVASIPYDTSKSMIFPDAKTWMETTNSRSRFKADTRRERTGRELDIEQKLRTPVSVRFSDMPLSQVLEKLQELAQVSIHLDPQGLEEEGVASSTPVNINLRDEVSLKSALNLILQPLHLSYVIKDEVLKITSEHYSDSEVYPVTYDVGDLVVPIPNFVPNSRMGLAGAYNDAMGRNGFNNASFGGGAPPLGVIGAADTPGSTAINAAVLANVSHAMPGSSSGPGNGAPMGFGPGGLGGGTQADFDPLIELITQTVKPETWQDFGGEGTIQPYENNLTLVIKQTEEVHAQIVDVLEQLRRLQDLQVTIEVRFITLNDDFFESIRVDFDFDIDDDIDRPYQVFGRVIDNGDDDDDDDDDDTQTEPNRDTTDVDHDRSVTVGLNAPGVFSADLDIPFVQGSYDLAVPQFGDFSATAGAQLGFAILSDIEAFFFINAAQGDSRTNILQAPKVTLFNGQMAFVSDISQSPFVMGLIPVVGDFAAAQQPVIVILSEGTFLTVQAVVSHDRRFVRLTVVPFFSQIGDVNTFTFTGRTTSTVDTSTEGNQQDPDDATKNNNVRTTTTEGTTVQLPTYSTISVSTTVSVPDGGTVLLGGVKRLSEGRNEFGVPILNKIPYINRLFKNVGIGRTTQSLMMTVTPRIIIQEEEEERIGAGPSGP
ncbi:MAG: hypothetical protein JW888_17855 [Pirellulales bacterium]|nr:hypothetical protein [Pirellulales bacterium]